MADKDTADLQRLLTVIQTYTDYENSLILTPKDVKNILDAEDFDHDNYEHIPPESPEKEIENTENNSYTIHIQTDLFGDDNG